MTVYEANAVQSIIMNIGMLAIGACIGYLWGYLNRQRNL